MARDRVGSSIISGESQLRRSEPSEHSEEIPRRSVEVLGEIMRIDAKIAGGPWHKLAQSDGTCGAECSGAIRALDLDIGLKQRQPVRNREPGLAQGGMAAIAQRGLLQGSEDCGLRDGWCERYRRDLRIITISSVIAKYDGAQVVCWPTPDIALCKP